ncbi:MAG: glutathione S-transferase [Alphaproteobacteria bacterium]|nr:glutathione S-transferase [Alphaproteobacteria bacterium]
MYTLFWAPGTAAIAPHVLFEEFGVPHRLVRVDLAAKEHHRPEYLKINPKGRVPALVDGETVLTEAAAIGMHLADRHPEAGLAPPVGTIERARYYQWLTYLTNTVQEAFICWYHPDWYLADAAMQAALKKNAEERLDKSWALIGEAVGDGPWFLGQRYTVCDVYLTMLVRWSRNLPSPAWNQAAVGRLADRVRARPAWQRMMAAQGIVWR